MPDAELIDLRPGGKYGAAAEPTPEEIRQRCAEIQSEWSPAEERNRRVVQFEPARIPCVSLQAKQ